MRIKSHANTLISIIRDHVEAWRKANGWSRETTAQAIVEAHERIGGPAITGIHFDPPTKDTFERAKVNADRIFRWLDDATKDTNLLPLNFTTSILEAMPMDRRMPLVNDLLRPLGLATRVMPKVDEGDATVMLFKGIVGSAGQAQSAMADLLDGVDPGELERAQSALTNAQNAIGNALVKVETKMGGQS